MKKLSYFVLTIAAATLFSCGGKTDSELQSQVDSLQKALDERTADYQNVEEALTVISSAVDSINMQQSAIFNPSKESPAPNAEQIKKDLAQFKETLKQQRQRIAQLEGQLKNSDANSKKLQSVIAALEMQLADKELQIAALEQEVSEQNLTIDDLRQRLSTLALRSAQQQDVISSQSQMMAEQDTELNAGYVVMGTKKQLKDTGVLTGGGLKKTKINVLELDKSMFEKIDIRNQTQINIESKSPKIKSQMPEDTYVIEKKGDISTLKIIDTKRFWGVTRYLVIQTD
ncbi:MAG: hypothetical protein IJU11_00495 [Prevotella sp.]|nr:hypothetical protein [Prevotella sp.]